MADNKRYYWLKLDENFFEDDTVAWLEEQKNGKDYIIFYLKLCLKSLKDDGKLIRYVGETLIPYDVDALSKLTNTNVDTVRTAMTLFLKIGLIEQLETGEIYMKQIEEMVGTETQAAQRMRRLRAKKNETSLIEDKKPERNNVQECYPDVKKSYTEIEIEKELDIDIEKDIDIKIDSKKSSPTPYKEIVDLYNEICVSLPKVIKITDKRKRTIKSRYKTYDNLDTYTDLFTKAEKSDFLSGRNGKWTNCNFDWLLNENNMIKVLEGNYRNTGGKNESRANPTGNTTERKEKSLNELIQEELERQGRTEL